MINGRSPVIQKEARASVSRLGQRRQVVIPKTIWEELRLKEGDFVEVKRQKRAVLIVPKKLVDADDTLLPEQKTIIDARLAQGLEDIAKGRVAGPFRKAGEVMRALRAKT